MAYCSNQKNISDNIQKITLGISSLGLDEENTDIENYEQEISTSISIMNLNYKKIVNTIKIPCCFMVRDLKFSPCSRWVAASTPNGILVTTLRPLPTVHDLMFREMGLSRHEQERLKRFRKKHKK